jgi:hypothetical protein
LQLTAHLGTGKGRPEKSGRRRSNALPVMSKGGHRSANDLHGVQVIDFSTVIAILHVFLPHFSARRVWFLAGYAKIGVYLNRGAWKKEMSTTKM